MVSENSCGYIYLHLPTDYRSADATERFIFVVVGGDWNTDLQQPGEFSDAVCLLLRELKVSLIDL